MKRLFAIAAITLMAGCASTPELIVGPSTNAQGQSVQPPPVVLPSGITADLQNASKNLDNGIAVGILSADDPAAACAHQALQMAGVEVPAGTVPAKSFVPVGSDVLAKASVLYILAKQAGQSPGLTVTVGCKALLGQMVIDGLGAANKLIPGQIFGNLIK